MIDGSRTTAEHWAVALKNAPDEMLRMGAVTSSQSLYTIGELTNFAREHVAEEEKRYITETSVGRALAKYGFHKIQNDDSGRIKIPGVGFVYMWIIRNAERLSKIKDPDRIRELYLKGRPKTIPGSKAFRVKLEEK